MYLSRLILNPRSNQVRRDIANCQELHRTILSAFPETEAASAEVRAQFGVLYRMEVGRQTDRVSLLVQSRVQPNWDALPLLYLLETGAERTNSDWKQIDLMLQGLKQGMRLTFRLRANPTRRVSARSAADDQQWHGKRVDLRREADQIEWLRRKGDAGGFKLLSVRVASSVPNLRIIPENKTIGWRLEKERPEQESKARLTFGSVVFEGELEITDADLLRRALERGIGPGKAYGFGLLSLAPPRG